MDKKKIIILICIIICTFILTYLIGKYNINNKIQNERCGYYNNNGYNVTLINTGFIRNGNVCYLFYGNEYIPLIDENLHYINRVIMLE